MPLKNQTLTLTYTAWNTTANAPAAGDVANHALKLVRDGSESSPANTPAEVDPAAAPGEYKLALTAAEMNADALTLCGVSSTAGVVVVPVKLATDGGLRTLLAHDAGSLAFNTAGMVWYVSTTGNDANDGRAWTTPFASPADAASVAAAGDQILLGPGTFALGNATLNSPDGVCWRGAGPHRTTITSTAVSFGTGFGVLFRLPSNATVEELCVQALSPQAAPLGFLNGQAATQAACVNTILRHVRTLGDSDGLLLQGSSPASVKAYGCEFNGKYDCVALFDADHSVQLYDPTLNAIGPSASDPAGATATHGLFAAAGTIQAYAGSIIAQNGATGETAAAMTNGGSVRLVGTTLYTSATTGTAIDLKNITGTLTSVACCGTGPGGLPTSSGTITLGGPLASLPTPAPIGYGATPAAGADPITVTITDGTRSVADANVWVSSDAAGTQVVAGSLRTNTAGQAKFLLTAGLTYYLWMEKDGVNPILGQSFVAVHD